MRGIRAFYHVLTLLMLLAIVPLGVLAQTTEYVTVQSADGDDAVVVRTNGSVFRITKGVGCLSLERYEGRRVLVTSPGLFLGVGASIIIPDLEQQCRVWDAEMVTSTRPRSAPDPPERRLSEGYVADQLSLFDSGGNAVAYLEPDGDVTFYLWTGRPVAYLVDRSVYGFNGKHLGWYEDGIVYDNDGGVIAAPASAFRSPVAPLSPRGLKGLKPLKALKELRPLHPLLRRTWGRMPAEVFFLLGVGVP